MLSLRALLSRHPVVLAIDSASTRIHAGILRVDRPPTWETCSDEAGVGLFAATERALQRAETDLSRVSAFVFCSGPGSVLGIRIAAVAIRTWNVVRARPSFSYGSLDLVAKFQLHQERELPFSVIADARRDTWHRVAVSPAAEVSPVDRAAPDVVTGRILSLEYFRHWTPLPPQTQIVPYDVAQMLEHLPDIPLFQEALEPDAFLHEQPVYQTWTPQVHRAPSS